MTWETRYTRQSRHVSDADGKTKEGATVDNVRCTRLSWYAHERGASVVQYCQLTSNDGQ